MSSNIATLAHQKFYVTAPATSFVAMTDSGSTILWTAFTAGPGGCNGPPAGRTNVVVGPSTTYVPTATNPAQGVTKDAAMIVALGRLADQLVALLPVGTVLVAQPFVSIVGGPPTGSGSGPIVP